MNEANEKAVEETSVEEEAAKEEAAKEKPDDEKADEAVNTAVFTAEQNMRLLELAHDCVYINSDEKEQTIKLLEEKTKEHSDFNVIDIFKEEAFLSEKRIERLLALDEHLLIHSRDRQFGQLAIANGLASEQDVYTALKYQKNYFEKNRLNMKIGDILVGNGSISEADQISILLTQNRIKNEDIADALTDLCKTQIEKEAINKRFGVLAIKKGLATIEQVNEALDIQEKEKNETDDPRFIGQILMEIASLSENDHEQILIEQKQFEKRRLDLERALYTVKSEIKISQKLNGLFEYTISNDGLEAVVKKRGEIDQDIPTYEFLIWLRRAGIKFGIVDDAIIEEFIQEGDIKDPVVVAKGHPVTPCTDESIQFSFENEDTLALQKKDASIEQETVSGDEQSDNTASDSESISSSEDAKDEEDKEEEDNTEEEKTKESETDQDSESETAEDKEGKSESISEDETEDDSDKATGEKSNEASDEKMGKQDGAEENTSDPNGVEPIDFIKKGSLLARILPGKKGRPGRDVLGYPIQPDQPAICVLNAGKGVIRKGPIFLSVMTGRPIFKNGSTLLIESTAKKVEVKMINGSISNDTEDSFESANVEMNGNIAAEAVLKCYALQLRGNLQGCVISEDDIEVSGDIGIDQEATEEQTTYPTVIVCKGSVKASKTIVNTKIQADGELAAFNSAIIGSEVVACKGITIKDSLTGKNGPSIFQFGLKPGDKLLDLDYTIENKNAQLFVLKKEAEIAQLTEEYTKELSEEQIHQEEQIILKCLIEIIEGPELYQYDELEDKLKYLYSLPDFSSIKAYYLKIPQTDTGLAFVDQILSSTQKVTLENIVKQLKKKIDPEPEEENTVSNIYRIETEYKARLAAIEKEVAGQSEEIEKIENEIRGLLVLKEKMGSKHQSSLSKSTSAIKIRNKCEQGTIIKGKIAQMVIQQTLHNVTFKEIFDPKTKNVSIAIET